MPDYAKMYRRLFNSQTDAITLLQQAQRDTEEMYVSSSEPELYVLDSNMSDDDSNSDE